MFKTYVKNRAHLEASMVERYLYDETIGFVIEYMQGFSNVQHRIWDVNEEKGVWSEVMEGVGIKFVFDNGCWDLAH